MLHFTCKAGGTCPAVHCACQVKWIILRCVAQRAGSKALARLAYVVHPAVLGATELCQAVHVTCCLGVPAAGFKKKCSSFCS
jgi:hypothetical protein